MADANPRGVIGKTWDTVTFSEKRKERRVAKLARKKQEEAEAEKLVGGRKDDAQRVDPHVDSETVKGEHLVDFNNMLINAITGGQSRTQSETASDEMMRAVVTNEIFIQAIQARAVPTPLEEVDEEYERENRGRRERLASELRRAREHPEYVIGTLDAHQLSILYSTMIGAPLRDEKDNDTQRPGAVELWEKEARWPDSDLPRPHLALFTFLESCAVRHKHDTIPEFLGSVCKDLSYRKGIEDVPVKTLRKLCDAGYINEYLYSQSSYPIEKAVESFHGEVGSILATGTGEMHPALDVPGVGYVDGFNAERERRVLWAEQAKPAVDSARAELEAAEKVHEKAKRFHDTAEQKGSIKLRVGGVETVFMKGDLKLRKDLRDATEMVRAARMQLEKAEREAKRREEDLAKFEREASPQAFAKELADHFKDLLKQNKEANASFDVVADAIAHRLPNPALTALLDKARKATETMVEALPHFNPVSLEQEKLLSAGDEETADKKKIKRIAIERGSDVAQEYVRRSVIGTVTKESEIFAWKKEEFDAKMAEFAGDVEAAELPEDVKVKLRSLHAAMSSLLFTKDGIDAQIDGISRRYAHPLRQAAKLAVRDLQERGYGNMTGITDGDKVLARMVYEARVPKVPQGLARMEGKWAKFWYWVKYHTLDPDSWVSRDPNQPGKLVWLWRKTFAKEVGVIFSHPRNWVAPTRGKKPDGTPYTSVWPQGLSALWGITWKGWIVGGLLAGHILSREEAHWYWPPSWPAPLVRMAGGPFYTDGIKWHSPYTWTMPNERERPIRRIIDDHYDIPARLASRSDDYYRVTYGLRARAPGEQDDSGIRRRLDWIRRHPDVLKFFQERRTLRHVTNVTEFHATPDRCSTAQRPIPEACDRVSHGTTLNTPELVANYTPLSTPSDRSLSTNNDRWTRGRPVCCTVEIQSETIRDGLMLNTAMAPQFVNWLIQLESGNQRIDYRTLTGAQMRTEMVNRWYLFTSGEDSKVREYGVSTRDNVRFLIMQGPGAGRILMNRCQFARDRDYIEPAHRDEFVEAFRGALRDAARAEWQTAHPGETPPELDLLTTRVESDRDQAFTAAYAAVKAAHPSWVRDVTEDYQLERVRDRLRVAHVAVQIDETVRMLRENDDILQLVEVYGNSQNRFGITPGREDEFVRFLRDHKDNGGSLTDFNYLSTQAGAGARMSELVEVHGLATERDEWRRAHTPNQSGGDAGAQAAPSVSASVAAPVQQPVPSCSADCDAFFSRPGNEVFRSIMNGAFERLFQDGGADAQTMNAALASRFNGNRDQMLASVRGEVYAFLTSTAGPVVQERNGYGLAITGTGAQMDVTAQNPRRTRDSLRNLIKRFATRMSAPAR